LEKHKAFKGAKGMSIYINRTLNMKKIKAVGLDMDYTLVRYHTEEFECLSYELIKDLLKKEDFYTPEIGKLEFDYERVIQGLIIDKERGNLLKVSRYGKVKAAFHGTKALAFNKLKKIYFTSIVDLNDPNFKSLDTCFSIALGVIYSQMVDLKSSNSQFPDYGDLFDLLLNHLDRIHRDGSLKSKVREDLGKYIIKDPLMVELLERYKKHGKTLMVITNSDFHYTKLLLDYTITPYLKDHKCWSELFQVTITFSKKPEFFTRNNSFLEIDPDTGKMSNFEGKVTSGIFQGGHAQKLQEDLNLSGPEILYIGDHIYGDVVSIKKNCNWRTALVVDPLAEEVKALQKGADIQSEIDSDMKKKRALEIKLNQLETEKFEGGKVQKDEIDKIYDDLEELNEHISRIIDSHKVNFNPHWGELMRSGVEESRFMDQVLKYACIYMSKVTDLFDYSPRSYFRSYRRSLPHEWFDDE
jgi:HAD superfamily 5'-nucleotidase-like hydrolase